MEIIKAQIEVLKAAAATSRILAELAVNTSRHTNFGMEYAGRAAYHLDLAALMLSQLEELMKTNSDTLNVMDD